MEDLQVLRVHWGLIDAVFEDSLPPRDILERRRVKVLVIVRIAEKLLLVEVHRPIEHKQTFVVVVIEKVCVVLLAKFSLRQG
jgi:hypothetical protein